MEKQQPVIQTQPLEQLNSLTFQIFSPVSRKIMIHEGTYNLNLLSLNYEILKHFHYGIFVIKFEQMNKGLISDSSKFYVCLSLASFILCQKVLIDV